MNLEIMQTAKLLRNGLLAAGLLLVGGCELLNLDDGGQVVSSADAVSAKLPPPPPPAPRVARPAARRLAPERDGTLESMPEPAPPQTVETTPRGEEPPAEPQPPSTAVAEAPAPEPVPQPSPQPAAPPAPQIAALPTPADLPPPVDPASEVRPQRVVGLTENALAGWLGSPANTREESPARVWRYQGIECAFDVFFYLDLVSREFRALRYEVKGSSNDDQRCLQPVFAGRGAPPRATARRVD